MGIVHNNPLMATTTGTVGQVYFRMVRGKQIVCARPKKDRKWTPRQLAWQKRFGELSKKTKAFLKDPEVKEKYQARIDNHKITAHLVAQGDLMAAPKVEKIVVSDYNETAGSEIVVKMHGGVGLTKLVVTVVAESGDVIESGDAVLDKFRPDEWLYKATIANPDFNRSTINVAAYSEHGNVGRKELSPKEGRSSSDVE